MLQKCSSPGSKTQRQVEMQTSPLKMHSDLALQPFFWEQQKALQLGNIIYLLFLCFCMTWVAQSSALQSHCTHAGPSGSLLIIAFWWELHVLPVSKEAAVLQNKLKFPYIEMPRQLSSKNKARFTGSADAQVNMMKLEKPFVQSKS